MQVFLRVRVHFELTICFQIDVNALYTSVIQSSPAVPHPDSSAFLNLPKESDESSSSSSEQISQLQLQQSWSDFLLQL
jgi:hypothetical protein